MTDTRVLRTSGGLVEIFQLPGKGPPVLFFPGGHCSAVSDCGLSMYSELGYSVVSFSRPGYGKTRVASHSAADFAPQVTEVCEQLGINDVAAVVGVSFGGMQAIHVANQGTLHVAALVLHSCAPSEHPYPVSRAETVGGPILFSPVIQAGVWWLVRQLIRTDAGLKLVMGRLSTLPADDWWSNLTDSDKIEARQLFRSMRSDSGFVIDLREGRAESGGRMDAIRRVRCSTLVTGSRFDRGVPFSYAQDFAADIEHSVLVDLESATHLFWIGERSRLLSTIRSFIRARP